MSGKKENQPTACVILAAGEGKRMRSPLPKVAHELGGRALVLHVLETALALRPEKTVAVIPPEAPVVERLLRGRCETVVQTERRGTADALARAEVFLEGFSGDVVVLCGDVPLLRAETAARLLAAHREGGYSATVLTAVVEDPAGYGRIVRGEGGKLEAIVEETDADGPTREIREINSGIYCFASPGVWDILGRIGDDNRQKEKYLTDAVRLLVASGNPVGAFLLSDSEEIRGINSREQLAAAEAIYRRREFHRKGAVPGAGDVFPGAEPSRGGKP